MNLIIEIISTALSTSVPIILAAFGGLFTWHANVFNISMEGMMLVSAFTTVVGSYFFESWQMGMLFGLIGSIVISLIFAFFVLKMKTGEFITGIAINTFAAGATTYFMRQLFNVKGSLISPRIQSMPSLQLDWLESIPFFGPIINGHPFVLYLTFIVIGPIISMLIFKTPFGLRLRACGQDSKVIDSVGVKSGRLKMLAIVICGALCGIAGSYLSIGIMRMYTENMSNGRGWISLAIIIVSGGRPLVVMLLGLVFGIMNGLGLALQQFNVPNQLTDMLPYIAVLFALFFNSQRTIRFSKKRSA